MNRDPYEVLGVSPSDTDDEVKKAYMNLARKYHPDRYQNNPLEDLAQEKFKEINEAYDAIKSMRKRAGQSSYGSGYGGSAYGNSYGGSSYGSSGGYRPNQGLYNQIIALIQSNQLARAEEMLIGIRDRDGYWYYLSGVLAARKGYINDALSYMEQACQMEPNNMEFSNAYNRLRMGGVYYANRSSGNGYGQSSACSDCITCYLCTSCLTPWPCC